MYVLKRELEFTLNKFEVRLLLCPDVSFTPFETNYQFISTWYQDKLIVPKIKPSVVVSLASRD